MNKLRVLFLILFLEVFGWQLNAMPVVATPATDLQPGAAQPVSQPAVDQPVDLPDQQTQQFPTVAQTPVTMPSTQISPLQPSAGENVDAQNAPVSGLRVEMGIDEAQAPEGQTAENPAVIGLPEELKPKIEDLDEEKNIYLNFDNADLSSFINYIAEIKKLNLIPDKSIEGAKISLTVRDPLTAEGAWRTFLTVLEMAGFSIIKVGDVYKVIPKDQKIQQPLPVYINVPPDTLPQDDSNIRYVLFLTNLNVSDYKDLLQNMLSDKGVPIDIKEVNAFIITDKSLNIISAAKLLLELDQMGGAETATFIRLKNANAIDVKGLLESLMKKPEVSPLARLLGKTVEGSRDYFPPGTRIVADERLNALILIGDAKPIKKIEDFIKNYVDTELKEAKSPLHVYELQYTDASQVADILREVTTPPESATGQAASKYGAIRGGVKYFRGMNFKVDKDGNKLIVSSADAVDWKLLKNTIKDLDKPQPQVAIETLIITVDIGDEKELSGATRNKKHGMLGKNIDFQSAALSSEPSLERKDSSSDPVSLLGNMISQITSRQGLATMTIGSAVNGVTNIWSIFQALKTQTNTSIVSQPFITVSNKTTARVKVGQEQRILQEQTGDGLKGYESVEANTEVSVTPLINLEGEIRLDIETNINEFLNTEGTEKVLRNLKTSVSVLDGQVLALGGFVKTKVAETTYKTPFLGDIPVLGWFFKRQNRQIAKSYIFIFMCPTIIKPRQQPGMNLYTKMKLHEATDSIEDGIKTKRTPDPIYNWFFNPEKENYSHKVVDFANARYQPTTVDIKNDPYYRAQTRNARDNDFEDVGPAQKNEPVARNSSLPVMVQNVQAIEKPVEEPKPPLPVRPIVSPQTESMPKSQPQIAASSAQSNLQVQPPAHTQMQQPVISSVPVVPEVVSSSATQNIQNDQVQRIEKNRELLKNTIAMPVDKEPVVQQGIVESSPFDDAKATRDIVERSFGADDSIKKRNRLKEFLSQNPALSQNSAISRYSTRRGLA